MTMHTVFFKEHGGIIPNPINGALSEVPRWSGLGSQPPAAAYGDTFMQSKLTSLELSAGGNQFTVAKEPEDQQGLGKGNTTQFTLFSGDCRTAENGAKTNLQTVSPVQAATMEYQGHFSLGFGQPMICAQYPYAEQCYGVYSTYGTQIPGRIMLPLSMASDGGPIFVNAKQYNRIMRRRKSRAKAEMENQVLKSRKPYMHLSRHLHAMRRPRGNGGRFLNTKNSNASSEKTSHKMTDKEEKQHPQPTESQISEVLQSDEGINSKGTNGKRSTSPGSEVTSHLFSSATTIHPFQIIVSTPLFSPFRMWQMRGLALPWLLAITSKFDDGGVGILLMAPPPLGDLFAWATHSWLIIFILEKRKKKYKKYEKCINKSSLACFQIGVSMSFHVVGMSCCTRRL
ncbi:hypothetical protein Pfo_004077 [Paulownia fortunei]|nr:hypothetical protein Pfo_004077 [Paulownia fortunei]